MNTDAGSADATSGQSSGMAPKDPKLFAGVMAATAVKGLSEQLAADEQLRRPRADALY